MAKNKIILIDGPTAVGKDYFIDNLKKEIFNTDPSIAVETHYASKFVDPKSNLTENRTYAGYVTDEDRREIIARNHIKLLTMVYEEAVLPAKRQTVHIISRDIITWDCYNVLSDIYRIIADKPDDWVDQILNIFYIRSVHLSNYLGVLRDILTKDLVDIYVVRLDHFKDGELIDAVKGAEITHSRLKSRKDFRDFNFDWYKRLITDYRSESKTIQKDICSLMTSELAKKAEQRFFTLSSSDALAFKESLLHGDQKSLI